VNYNGAQIFSAYKIDLLGENQVALEIKSVQELLPARYAQLMTYLRLGNYPVSLLFNFNRKLLKGGGMVRSGRA
jgi:GxxExxY protein